MTKYPGLCVGGPFDGQRMISQTESLYAETTPDLPPISAGPTPMPLGPISITRIRYQWHRVAHFALWVPEGTTLEVAMNELMLAYERERGK